MTQFSEGATPPTPFNKGGGGSNYYVKSVEAPEQYVQFVQS